MFCAYFYAIIDSGRYFIVGSQNFYVPQMEHILERDSMQKRYWSICLDAKMMVFLWNING
jgi:hypothetical protein